MYELIKNSTDVSLVIVLRDAFTGAPKTGLTINTIETQFVRVENDNDVTFSGWTALSALSALTDPHADNKGLEVSTNTGNYRIDVPDGFAAIGAGQVKLLVRDTGFLILEEEINIQLMDGPSVHIWHVAKTGNNDNAGHTFSEAFLDIGPAVTAAVNGDKIIIWPGDYDETVDLDAANKSLTLEGTSRYKSRIIRTGASERCILLEDNTVIRNLSVSSTDKSSSSVGILGSSKSNIIIDNCDVIGSWDGMLLTGCTDIWVKDSYIKGDFDGINLVNADRYLFDNCVIRTDGSYGTGQDARAVLTQSGMGLFRNCMFEAKRDDASARYTAAFFTKGLQDIFINCIFEAVDGSSNTGNLYGIYLFNADTQVNLNSCNIITDLNGSGDVYDLFNFSTSILNVSNCVYNTTKVSGTIIVGGSGTIVSDAAGTAATLHGVTDGKIDVIDANVDQIETAVITNADGTDIAADIIAVKAETASIQAETTALDTLTKAAGDGDVAAIKAKTDNLPADPASETNVDANETKIDAIIVQTTRVDALLEDSGGDRYTAKALETAPSGTGSTPAAFVAALLAETGWTVGGSMSIETLYKITAAFVAGNWREKSGDITVSQLLDADDGSTPILEMTVDSDSPFRSITVL